MVFSLEERWLLWDLIEVFEVMKSYGKLDSEKQFLSVEESKVRQHGMTVIDARTNSDMKKNCVTQ